MKREESLFDNGFFEFIKTEEEYNIQGEKRIVNRSMVRRPPGIRAIIFDNKLQKILFSHEFRYELNSFDYRLPGGKVFDTLKDYQISIKEETVDEYVLKAVKREVREEVGIEVKNEQLYRVSRDGAGVIWDLFYFIVTDYEIIQDGQQLEENEIVDGFVWKSFDEVIDMCIRGDIHEERTVGVLLTYILKEKQK